MKAQTDHFRVSSNAQDRIKLPRVFWAGLKSIGLTPGAILRRSNLPPTVYSGESFVTTAQSFSIWQAIRELCNDPTVGWKFMSQVETDQYHPTLLAALHARTYREAIERLAPVRKSTEGEANETEHHRAGEVGSEAPAGRQSARSPHGRQRAGH
jgi:Arabinose-binding domain of AraC transcription regulator, N-term